VESFHTKDSCSSTAIALWFSDSELAEETGVPIAKVRQRIAELAATGTIITPQSLLLRADDVMQ
jgi:hypothetical protein